MKVVSKLAIFSLRWSRTALQIFFVSLQTIPLCMVGDFAGGWSVAVVVGISDMWQVTSDTQHIIPELGHLTPDICPFFIIFPNKQKNDFHIGATIRTHSEILCLPYAVFVLY